jgi:hypothetical protein
MKIKSVTYHSQDEANMAAAKTMARLAAREGQVKELRKMVKKLRRALLGIDILVSPEYGILAHQYTDGEPLTACLHAVLDISRKAVRESEYK